MAFSTDAPLSSVDTGFLSDVYVRDVDTGLTLLASRASGPSGAVGNGSSYADTRPVISGDGRYVAFQSSSTNLSPDDTDTKNDIYVHDMQSNTTMLVSRATGAGGAKGNGDSTLPQISANGRYVVFNTDSSNMDPADADATLDVYMRDLQTDTTILVDRANGLAGAKATAQANRPSVSSDGRVAFASTATNLSSDDSDTTSDVFIRDTQAGTTTLVSRATGATGAKGNSFSGLAQISADGLHVAWTSNAFNLDPADTTGTTDAFARDLQSNTTYLVSRATGAAGAKGNGQSGAHSISADGRYVGWGTDGTNVDPDDTDTSGDLYVRDLQTSTTTLVTRATGATGAKANSANANIAISGDARFASFFGTATNLDPDDTNSLSDVYVRDLQTFQTSYESRGTPGHARPKGATPLRASLVPAYTPCSSSNRTHGPPLAFPSCNPPSQISPNLTVGTPDANGAAANSIGSVLLTVVTGDVLISASMTDVRCAAALPTCGAANTVGGADYTGELRGSMSVRQTDKYDSMGEAISQTMSDTSLEFTFGCATTAASAGASCSTSTTANALVPGMVRNGDRNSMQLGAVQLLDGGPDGDADTAGNSLFATQGVFVP